MASQEQICEQRIHISNLPPDITSASLKNVFPNICSVTNIEIRKNNYFVGEKETIYAFVTVSGTVKDIENWCNRVSSARIKGLKLSVQKAKESFLVRLQKELHAVSNNSVTSSSNENKEKKVEIRNLNVILPNKKIVFSEEELPSENVSEAASNSYQFASLSSSKPDESSKIKSSLKNVSTGEAKRLMSLAEKNNFRKQQQNAIKQSLSLQTSGLNKKIIFSDADNFQRDSAVGQANAKNKLFLDSDDSLDEAEYDFSADKPSYKIVQTSFSTCDERFRLDHRFSKSHEPEILKPEESELNEELQMSSKILDSIIGYSSDRKHTSQKTLDKRLVPRYDPLKNDHEKYIITAKQPEESIDNTQKAAKDPFKVSKERFYHFSDELTDILKEPPVESNSFSLLKLFGEGKEDGILNEKESGNENQNIPFGLNNMDQNGYDSSSGQDETTNPAEDSSISEEKVTLSAETLFIQELSDPRLQTSMEFFKGPAVSLNAHAKKRKKIKKIVGVKLKKFQYSSTRFSNKLGSTRRKKRLRH